MWGLLAAAAGVAALLLLARHFSPQIYDVVIIHMTEKWYLCVLQLLPDGARVLDIGIGTGTALLRHKALILKKNLRVVGVDYNATYVRQAQRSVEAAGLASHVRVVHASIYDPDILAKTGGPFDAAYFSGSFSLMPQPAKALRDACEHMVKPGGHVYITQTFQRKALPGMALAKPLIRYVTTIDFGQLTFESDLDRILKEAAVETLDRRLIPGSIDNKWQGAWLVVARRRA